MFILSRKQALKATQEGFLKNGEEMLGNLFNIWFLSAEQSLTNDVIENHVRWEFINVLYQVIKIAIHVQLVLHFKTFLRKFHRNYFSRNVFKTALTLQESASKTTMKSQIETSIPIPNQ